MGPRRGGAMADRGGWRRSARLGTLKNSSLSRAPAGTHNSEPDLHPWIPFGGQHYLAFRLSLAPERCSTHNGLRQQVGALRQPQNTFFA